MDLAPTTLLRSKTRARLLTSPVVKSFLVRDPEKNVQDYRISVVGENDPPIIIVSTPEEDSVTLNDSPSIDRTHVKLMIESISFAENPVRFDDLNFEIRRLLSTWNTRFLVGPIFSEIRHKKTTVQTLEIGTKPGVICSSEFSVYFDLEYELSEPAETFEGVVVNDFIQ
jgi:hypothetical protein